MAGLNLIPNPTMVVIHSGIFLASLYVVKKLFADPYAKLRERRQRATLGNKDEAATIQARNEERLIELNKRLAANNEHVKALVQKSKVQTQQEKEAILADAEKDAAATIAQMRSELEKSLTSEQQQVPALVGKISDALIAKLLS